MSSSEARRRRGSLAQGASESPSLPARHLPPTDSGLQFSFHATCLSSLPTEIKSLIVEWVAEDDVAYGPVKDQSEIDCASAWTARRGEDSTEDDRMERSGGQGIQAVSLMSREFATLAQPYLWRAVQLCHWNVEGLVYFVSTILPRHGHHVRSLGAFQYRDSQGGARDYIDADVYRLGRALLGGTVAAPAFEGKGLQTFLRQRDLLFARAIEGMPNLVKCTSNIPVRPHHDLAAENAVGRQGLDSPAKMPCDEVVLALAGLGDRLAHLHFAYPHCNWGTYSERTLAAVLSRFSLLRRLTLSLSGASIPGQDHLIIAITSLQHLHHLEIRDYKDFVGHALAEASWACPLETLSLTLTQSPSPPLLFRLVRHFSATLTTLKLETLDIFDREDDPTTLISAPLPLPHLRNLDLSVPVPTTFLSSFIDCPLQYITIGQCRELDDNAWKRLIHSHAGTLKRVIVFAEAKQFSRNGVDYLWRFCRAKGVELQVNNWSSDFRDSPGASPRASLTRRLDDKDVEVGDADVSVGALDRSDNAAGVVEDASYLTEEHGADDQEVSEQEDE